MGRNQPHLRNIKVGGTLMFTDKEVKLVKNLGEIVARIQQGFVRQLNKMNNKLSNVERRIFALEQSDSNWSREFYKKRITERIEVGNKKDFLFELAKRVEKLEYESKHLADLESRGKLE